MAPEALFDRKYTVKSDVYVDLFYSFSYIIVFDVNSKKLHSFVYDLNNVFLSADCTEF